MLVDTHIWEEYKETKIVLREHILSDKVTWNLDAKVAWNYVVWRTIKEMEMISLEAIDILEVWQRKMIWFIGSSGVQQRTMDRSKKRQIPRHPCKIYLYQDCIKMEWTSQEMMRFSSVAHFSIS